jgi:hypothetical protein
MNGATRRILPVLASIAIIIVIAVLRDRSKALAAITATMPVSIALGLWIVYAGEGGDRDAVISFTRSMVLGIVGTASWLLAVWLGARAGWGLGRLLLVGYGAWALAISIVFVVQPLLGGAPPLPD